MGHGAWGKTRRDQRSEVGSQMSDFGLRIWDLRYEIWVGERHRAWGMEPGGKDSWQQVEVRVKADL